MKQAVIIDAICTPIGRGHADKGSLRAWHPVKLYAHVINAVLAKTGLSPDKVDQSGQGQTGIYRIDQDALGLGQQFDRLPLGIADHSIALTQIIVLNRKVSERQR